MHCASVWRGTTAPDRPDTAGGSGASGSITWAPERSFGSASTSSASEATSAAMSS